MTRAHEGRIAAAAGTPLGEAKAAVVLLHGRGDSAQGILQLADQLATPGLAYLAPQATNNSWYPFSFLEPLERNEPWLGSALEAVGGVIEEAAGAGIGREKVALVGFSQGACLASEYAARTGGRFGAIVAFSGGLIGPDETSRAYGTDLASTPAFLGCSDVDPHIPVDRVHQTARVLESLGASIEKRIYPGMPHTVNADELAYAKGLLAGLV